MVDVSSVDRVTVIVAAHPNRLRNGMLQRALQSVWSQRRQPDAVVIANDRRGSGSAVTRNRALSMAQTQWVAFLDSDDVLLPHHLEHLLQVAEDTGADVVYPACRVIDENNRTIPTREEWGRPGQEFDAQLLREKSYIPVTSLVRRTLTTPALFGPPPAARDSDYDDWGAYLRLLDTGARFVHTPVVTWVWYHHGQNTSGRVDRGDAK